MTMPGGVANSVEYPFVDAHVHVWGQDVARFPFMPLDGLPSPPATSATVEEFFAPPLRAGRARRMLCLSNLGFTGSTMPTFLILRGEYQGA